MTKLPWDPPKWKSYTLNASRFEVELENGEVYKGIKDFKFIAMKPNHPEVCLKIFGQSFAVEHVKEVLALSRVLDLDLDHGNWPEYRDVEEFLKRYYERVAKPAGSIIHGRRSKASVRCGCIEHKACLGS